MAAFASPSLEASAALRIVRVGKCKVCGRKTPGIFVPNMGRLCEGECPMCGIKPYYLDKVANYAGDVSRMSVEDALAYVRTMEDPNEIETTFRLEVMGNPPRGRREYLAPAYEHYWSVAMYLDPYERAEILTLDQCINAWIEELKDPRLARYYQALNLAV